MEDGFMGEREGSIDESVVETEDAKRFLEKNWKWVGIGLAGGLGVVIGSRIAFGLVRRMLLERAKGKTAEVLDSLADLEERDDAAVIRLEGPEELSVAVPVEKVMGTAESLAGAIEGSPRDVVFRKEAGSGETISLSELLRLIKEVCRINAGWGAENPDKRLSGMIPDRIDVSVNEESGKD